MDFMQYPEFNFIESRGQFLPVVRLTDNFKELVTRFYEQRRKQEVETYAKIIEDHYLSNKLEVTLQWTNEDGLTNISVGPSGGLDLETRMGFPRFQEHNLGTKTGLASGMIAIKYVQELLKSK